jgi:hypothetical protein
MDMDRGHTRLEVVGYNKAEIATSGCTGVS